MIDQRRALMRQLQEMFHLHLVGVFRWDEGEILKPKEAHRDPGKPREAGKYQDQVTMRLPGFTIEVIGPSEDPKFPCGLARVTRGSHSMEGPLDSVTWARLGNFIKEKKQEEVENGDEAAGYASTGGDWGR